MDLSSVNQLFGNVDIYLLDQILKKKFQKGMTVLDAGCGEGRNLTYFINTGFDVYGVDLDPEAVRAIQFIAASTRPDLSKDNFQQGDISNLSFADGRFDLIISSAVLHFAKNENHFSDMFRELVRCLKPGGMLFIRMASNIGIEDKVMPIGAGRYKIPDGTERFLLTRKILNQLEHTYPIHYLEPFKTVNVNDQRVMSTLIITST